MGRISKIEKARADLEQLRHEANKSVLSAEDVETLLWFKVFENVAEKILDR